MLGLISYLRKDIFLARVGGPITYANHYTFWSSGSQACDFVVPARPAALLPLFIFDSLVNDVAIEKEVLQRSCDIGLSLLLAVPDFLLKGVFERAES